jgi:hypothetical protein
MKATRPQDWSLAAKTKALLETRFMTEEELGLYLRSKGLYSTIAIFASGRMM